MRGSRETADPKSAAHPLHTAALVCAIAIPLVLAGWLQTDPEPQTAVERETRVPASAPRVPVLVPAAAEPELAARPSARSEAAAPTDLAARARADARRIRNTRGFTLQFAVMCREGNVRQLLEALERDPRLYVLPASLDGRPCHRLCYGAYQTAAEARDERAVPQALRGITPSPRAVSVAQVAP